MSNQALQTREVDAAIEAELRAALEELDGTARGRAAARYHAERAMTIVDDSEEAAR
jgi:hypothetical protein